MPFDEDTDSSILEAPNNAGLKKVSSKKSIFDTAPKKPSFEDFSKKVDNIQENSSLKQQKAIELSKKFQQIINDKTLNKNKTIFSKQFETEVLKDFITFGISINNDPNEPQEGTGSISLIAIILNCLIKQRDRINELEYNFQELNKKNVGLDTSKINE